MKQTHKKALLAAALLSAVLAGTMLALFPSWERRREKQEQEAMIVRLAGEVQETEASPRTEPETEPPAETEAPGETLGEKNGESLSELETENSPAERKRKGRKNWRYS